MTSQRYDIGERGAGSCCCHMGNFIQPGGRCIPGFTSWKQGGCMGPLSRGWGNIAWAVARRGQVAGTPKAMGLWEIVLATAERAHALQLIPDWGSNWSTCAGAPSIGTQCMCLVVPQGRYTSVIGWATSNLSFMLQWKDLLGQQHLDELESVQAVESPWGNYSEWTDPPLL